MFPCFFSLWTDEVCSNICTGELAQESADVRDEARKHFYDKLNGNRFWKLLHRPVQRHQMPNSPRVWQDLNYDEVVKALSCPQKDMTYLLSNYEELYCKFTKN